MIIFEHDVFQIRFKKRVSSKPYICCKIANTKNKCAILFMIHLRSIVTMYILTTNIRGVIKGKALPKF